MPDIIDLKIDTNNWDSILIENQDLATVSGIDAIEQHLHQRFKFFRGEYKHDLTRGIPYHDEFFKKNPSPIVMDAILKDVILTTPGIIELTEFFMDLSETTRILSVTFKAKTDFGILDYNEFIPLG